jgi:PAS domain S-box-containing protein
MSRAEYLIGDGPQPLRLTTSDILQAFEDGLLDGETIIRVQVDQPGRPLRRLLKELVLEANERLPSPTDPGIAPDQFQAAFEHCPVGVVITDFMGRLTHVNPAYARMLRTTPESLVGESVRVLTHPDDQHLDTEHANALLNGRCAHYVVQKRFLPADDSAPVPASVCVSLLYDESRNPTGVLGFVNDETEAQSQRSRTVRSDRFELLGRLVGSVAHDMNNLLMVIQASTLFIEMQSGSTQHSESINDATSACVRLTRQLLDFLRSTTAASSLPINQVLSALNALLRRLTPASVNLTIESTVEQLVVQATATQFEQVVLNLVSNALQAMPDGGTLSIRLTRERTARGAQACLAVEDTGIGMDEATQARIFEPFFTTREDGSGIGLSTVHDIMKAVSGSIEYRSTLGEGTCVRTLWPLSSMPLTAPPATRMPQQLVVGAPRRLLLVEDDSAVRAAIADILKRAGHEVTTARSAETALAWVSTHAEPFDVLITDVVLTGRGGSDLHAAVEGVRGATPVIFMTGYAPQMVERVGIDSARFAVIEKPFHPGELLSEIQRITAPLPPTNAQQISG